MSDYENILDAAGSGIILFKSSASPSADGTRKWTSVYHNAEALKMLSPESLDAKLLTEIFDSNVAAQLASPNTLDYFVGEHSKWLRIISSVDEDQLLVTIQDITDLKQEFFQEVRMTQMYKALSGSLSDNEIILFDQDFNIIFAEGQPAFIRIPEETILGKNFKDLIKSGKFSYLDSYIQKVFEVNRQDIEHEIEGMYYRCSMYSNIAENMEGQPNIGVILLKDITEIKKKNQEIESLYQKILKSNQALEDFAYTASHDLQAPLRKIQSFGKLLNDRFGGDLPHTGKQFLDKMISAAHWMGKLLDDLLSYSRATRSDAIFEKTDIKSIIERVIRELNTGKLSSPPQIDMNGQWPEIDAIPMQLEQLFQNLLENSIKFSQKDKPAEISITGKILEEAELFRENVSIEGPHLEISVLDNGIGFEQEHAEQIFQIFQRLHGKSEFTGSGVGLAICKKVVENHHGNISAQGMPEEGATFTILLPITQL